MDNGVVGSNAGGAFINYELFESERFNVDSYVKKIAAESIYASSIAETKDKLNRSAVETAEEIKQSVYKNYTNFMETAKEVGHLEGKMSQLRQSLDEQRKLLNLFKNLNVNSINFEDQTTPAASSSTVMPDSNSNLKSSLTMLLEQVEGCGLITQKPGRTLLYHSDLEALHLDDYSVSHKLHVYLLNDALLLTSPQRKRNRAGLGANSSVTGSANSTSASMASLNMSTNRLLKNPLLMVDVSSSSQSGNNSGHLEFSSNSYQYKFQAFYELEEVKIMNIDDSKEVRNAFQLLKFPESLAFRCPNAHVKKEWLENIEYAKLQLQSQLKTPSTNEPVRRGFLMLSEDDTIHEEDEDDDDDDDSDSDTNNSAISSDEERYNTKATKVKKPKKKKKEKKNVSNMNEQERNQLVREKFSDFDILLAQRDFENAVETLLNIKQVSATGTPGSLDSVHQLIYKQKEAELISVLRKDLVASKERGSNSKGVIKTGKRVVSSLIKLKIYDQAIDLFIDYHKHLNAETLKKIKLEESNNIYMNNVLTLFFDNLLASFVSFREAFAGIINYCYSSYITWCDTEIEILIKKLQSQHYLGRHFALTVENSELIFVKARQFSEKNQFEVRFLFETKLCVILEKAIREQHEVLVEASKQRAKLELEDDNPANTEQNRLVQIDKLVKDIEQLKLSNQFTTDDFALLRLCTSSCVQFSRSCLNFFCATQLVYYQDINYAIVEAFTKLFKGELKIYQHQWAYNNSDTNSDKNHQQQKQQQQQQQSRTSKAIPSGRINKTDIINNVTFVEKVLLVIEKLFFEKTGVHSKFLIKVHERYAKFREEIKTK